MFTKSRFPRYLIKMNNYSIQIPCNGEGCRCVYLLWDIKYCVVLGLFFFNWQYYSLFFLIYFIVNRIYKMARNMYIRIDIFHFCMLFFAIHVHGFHSSKNVSSPWRHIQVMKFFLLLYCIILIKLNYMYSFSF